MTTTTTTPTEAQLATMVLIGAFDSILDTWESANGCVAWVEKSDRRCGRTSPGYLCGRHETMARRRWETHQAKEAQRAEISRAHRAMMLPQWRNELARVEARIEAQGFALPKNNLADVYDARNNPGSRGRRPTPGASLHLIAERLRTQIHRAEQDKP